MRLFISHASEDKQDFVRPLAEALRKEYEVWYDEYELTVGDSLLKKIDQGLRSSDFGIVVLSRFFFAKKWPQAELDGLFALESTTRKMILPVWKGVSIEEVRNFSPILAGRLGANASDGIEKVVGELRRAIEVSSRQRELDASGSIIEKAKLVDRTLQESSNSERLSRCEEGVAIVKDGFSKLLESFRATAHSIQSTSQNLKFGFDAPAHPLGGCFTITTNQRLGLSFLLMGLGGNWTYDARLIATVYEQDARFLSRQPAPPIREKEFTLGFRLPAELAWIDSQKRMYSNSELVDFILGMLLDEIQKRFK